MCFASAPQTRLNHQELRFSGGFEGAPKDRHRCGIVAPISQFFAIPRPPRRYAPGITIGGAEEQARTQGLFAEQERKAFDLGRRMAEAGFTLQDNPFEQVHPRFAAQWAHGYFAANTLRGITSALVRGALEPTPTA
jgi:hypothetical protein